MIYIYSCWDPIFFRANPFRLDTDLGQKRLFVVCTASSVPLPQKIEKLLKLMFLQYIGYI